MSNMIVLGQLDLLIEADKLLAAVTDAQILRAGARMGARKKNEKVLGTVHNDAAKRAYVAHITQKAVYIRHAADAQVADSEMGEDAAHIESHKASEFADLLFEIAWSQIRSDMNHWCGNIGLRKDWLAVTWEDSTPEFPEAIKRMLNIE